MAKFIFCDHVTSNRNGCIAKVIIAVFRVASKHLS